jgi:hypothetical protein
MRRRSSRAVPKDVTGLLAAVRRCPQNEEVRRSRTPRIVTEFCTVADMAEATDTRALAAAIEGRCDSGGGERGSETYCPATISNGDTQVTGSCTLLHLGQVRTCVPVSRLPSPERHSETVICHELTQERPGLQ